MQRIPQDLRVQVDISPGPPLRLTFYRLLALPPGDARSLIALCSRDVLSTRSAEEAGHYLRARSVLPMWLGLAARAKWQNLRLFLTLPSRVIQRVTGAFRDTKPCESGSAHVVVLVTAQIRRQLIFCGSSMGTRGSPQHRRARSAVDTICVLLKGTGAGQAPSSRGPVYMTATS